MCSPMQPLTQPQHEYCPVVRILAVFTPDGAFAYVVNEQGPFPPIVSVIDVATNTVTATVEFPQAAPSEIAIRPGSE